LPPSWRGLHKILVKRDAPQAFPVQVSEAGQSFEVRIKMGASHANAEVDNGLIHVRGIPSGARDDETTTHRAFDVPGDLERSLVKVQVEEGDLVVTIPRTAETTRVVRQLESGASR
jgi:hypothetical protein